MLVTADRRFFTADLERRLETFLGARMLFGPELLALADRAEADGGLPEDQAAEFLRLATEAFELSREPVDQAWYDELEAVSAVAADIGGIASTHINHLTPRVLDIDDLYARMEARGITMIDAIQGPPRWDGPGRAAPPDVVPRARRAAHLPHGRRRDRARRPAGAVRRGRGPRHRADPRGPRRVRRRGDRDRRGRRRGPGRGPRLHGGAAPGDRPRRLAAGPSRRPRRSSPPRASAGSPTNRWSSLLDGDRRAAANPSSTRTSSRGPRPASSSPT